MDIAAFLLERIADDEALAWGMRHESHDGLDVAERLWAECMAKRAILQFHESWLVLVTAASMPCVGDQRQQIAWVTEMEYRLKFGAEPPTSPILKALAAVYARHPDYDEAWRP